MYDVANYYWQNGLYPMYEKEMMKSKISMAKTMGLCEMKDMYAQRREVRHETQKERAKTKYYEIEIGGAGELKLQTKNSWIDVPERGVANFKYKGLFPLVSSDGDKGIFVLDLEIGNDDFYVYLDESKIAKNNYLMRKITFVGGRIFVNSQKFKEELLKDFWTTIYPLRIGDIIIPTHTGWVELGNNSFKFVEEGETLWQDIIKRAK